MRSVLSLAACACSASALRLTKEGLPAAATDSWGNYWPASRGMLFQQGTTALVGPTLELDEATENNSKILWSFHHPDGVFHSIPLGSVVDNEKNIVVTMDNAIFKVHPNGTALWRWEPPMRDSVVTTVAALGEGRLFFSTSNGKIWCLNPRDGRQIWVSKVSHIMNTTDRGFIGANEGKVIAAFNSTAENERGTNGLVVALDSEHGFIRWVVMPEIPTSCFQPCFTSDGSVLFQDGEGTAYRYDLESGEQEWEAEGVDDTWTRGSPVLANGVFYTVASNTEKARRDDEDGPDDLTPGWIFARSAEDGALLWRKRLPLPADSPPAVGKLPGREGLSVVVPVGQTFETGQTAVIAYDAVTGDKQWTFEGPTLQSQYQAGIEYGAVFRILGSASQMLPLTHPWSAPLIDGAGTVYVGNQDGKLYSLRDVNMDGKIEGAGEIGSMDFGAASFATASPIIVPGMFLFTQTNSLVALKAPSSEVPVSA